MANEITDTSYNMSTMDNEGYANLTALQIRLDTNPIIENFEMFITGSQVVAINTEHGQILRKQRNPVLKKVNDKGVQTLLNYVSNIINTQTVQGNTDEEWFTIFIAEKRIELIEMCLENCENWEMDEDDIQDVVDSAANLIELFLSRTINNKERDSYATTIRTHETNSVSSGKQEKPHFTI